MWCWIRKHKQGLWGVVPTKPWPRESADAVKEVK